ncbi:MAG: PhoH family protein [Thauera sp.]|jgi:PhoH-like ATPase|nr:PhoH family protein [Thauera sp.]
MATTQSGSKTQATSAQAASGKKRKACNPGTRDPKWQGCKLFVIDTNVLMHDPTSLYRFEEHDLYLPMMTLEELDHNKKGMTEVARNARQASRSLDEIVSSAPNGIDEGIELATASRGLASGRLFLQTRAIDSNLPAALPTSRADNQLLAVVMHLADSQPTREVVLVSKDINMRIKARALGLAAQDYFNDKVLEDSDLLYAGSRALPEDFWEEHGRGMESWKEEGHTWYRLGGPLASELLRNEFVYESSGDNPLQARVSAVEEGKLVLQSVVDYSHQKNSVWGITARNREQNFALNLLMDPEIDLVTLLGQAGTGKTLLTLAAGLAQVLDTKRYAEIIMTRVTVSVGEDIGFLPGTEEEKMAPWMGALEDNLEVLNGSGGEGGDWGRQASADLIHNRIKIKSLNFMRGRTFLNKFLIIDEAQNLTPKQMKTLITRAGPGTKVVCLGNIAQIDTPYLTEGSSGLTFVVDRFKGWPHSGHITLQRGERSRLADFASEVL